jgi:hypothetical protein
MTDFLLCFSFLPVPSGAGSGYAPSAVVQLFFAAILAAWLLQLVRLAFLIVQWRMKVPARENSRTEIDANSTPAMGKL